jgi:hypothetical protein
LPNVAPGPGATLPLIGGSLVAHSGMCAGSAPDAPSTTWVASWTTIAAWQLGPRAGLLKAGDT